MTRATLILASNAVRDRAHNWIDRAPVMTRVQFAGPKRTVPQSDKMWAMLGEVAAQVPWHGLRLSADDYKLIFLDALKREVRMVPNLDGNGFVSLGRSSSALSKSEMSDLIELIYAWGIQHGVKFHTEENAA